MSEEGESETYQQKDPVNVVVDGGRGKREKKSVEVINIAKEEKVRRGRDG